MDGSESIIKTLLYSEIFDYPLTKEEIFKFLISKEKVDFKVVVKILKSNLGKVEKSDKFYFTPGNKSLVSKRIKRNEQSEFKLKFAKEIIRKISKIPTIKFVGISGALSMLNSDEDDDIDIFVITEKKQVWTTRFLLILLLSILGVYRSRNTKSVKNKICLNMMLDENNMSFNKKYYDLFTAHEILQMIPVFERNNTYSKFLRLNSWTNSFLPNAGILNNHKIIKIKKSILENFITWGLSLMQIEKIIKNIQIAHMRNHITNETVKDGFLAFHPRDYRKIIHSSYLSKLKKYSLKLQAKNY